jgi:uncharacterized repeat protein (TIGR01451 family)
VYSAGPPARIEWNLGTVASGDSISITVTVEVDGSIVLESYALNTANAIWKDLSENPYGPETSEWQTRIDVDPELAIVKEGPAATTNDSDMTYTITLSNIGTGPAYDVILLDQLPPWTSFVSSSHTAVYNVESNAVDWNLGTLPAGTSITVSVTVHVDQAAPGETRLNNAVNATGEDSSGDPLDPAEASWDTIVYTHPLLTIEKAGPAIAYPGDTLEYTIVVTNTGGSDAFDVVVVDDLPIGFGYHGSTPAGMHSDGIVMWSLGTVPVSGSVEIKVSATVEAGFTDQTMLINTTGVLWGDFLDRSWGPVYNTADTTIYGRQGGGGASDATVGLDVYPVNKLIVMAPWIILFMALIGAIIAIARYGRLDSN